MTDYNRQHQSSRKSDYDRLHHSSRKSDLIYYTTPHVRVTITYILHHSSRKSDYNRIHQPSRKSNTIPVSENGEGGPITQYTVNILQPLWYVLAWC